MSVIRLEIEISDQDNAYALADDLRSASTIRFGSIDDVSGVTVVVLTNAEVRRERAILAGAEAMAKWVRDATS